MILVVCSDGILLFTSMHSIKMVITILIGLDATSAALHYWNLQGSLYISTEHGWSMVSLFKTGDKNMGNNTRQQVRLQFLLVKDEERARQLVHVAGGSVAK